MIEVATIGREGMVGISAVLGGRSTSSSAAIVQGATDTCYRMTADALRSELDRRGAFYDILTDYTEALIGFIMQSTACNAVHTVEQRLARWLLMAHDRMESDDFPLTQEFAAMMLGATRPTVSIVAGTLQHAGLITYFRGQVTDPEPQAAGSHLVRVLPRRDGPGAGRDVAPGRPARCRAHADDPG